MARFLSPQALDALKRAYYAADVSRLFLTRDNLPAQVYREVKEVCIRLGGRWNTGSQAFLFPYDPTQALELVLASGQLPPKNPYAFFPSPDSVSEALLRYGFQLFGCNLCEGYRHDRPLHDCQYLPSNLRILEPSAGLGAVARRVRQLYASMGRDDYVLHCCELNPVHREILDRQGFQVVAADFLAYGLQPGAPPYDVVLMNPPFQKHTYIDHVMHAWELTNPEEGTLTTVAPIGFTQHEDPRSRALYSLVCQYGVDTPTTYPAGLFKGSGASVKTMLLPLRKRDVSWRERAYQGYPDWHCAMLDFWLHQTERLCRQMWSVWERIEAGELAGDPAQPEWEDTRQLLHAMFLQTIDLARANWVEIRLNEERLRFLEQHFLAQGALECQCSRHAALRKAGEGRIKQSHLLAQSSAELPLPSRTLAFPEKAAQASSEMRLALRERCVQLPLFPACLWLV